MMKITNIKWKKSLSILLILTLIISLIPPLNNLDSIKAASNKIPYFNGGTLVKTDLKGFNDTDFLRVDDTAGVTVLGEYRYLTLYDGSYGGTSTRSSLNSSFTVSHNFKNTGKDGNGKATDRKTIKSAYKKHKYYHIVPNSSRDTARNIIEVGDISEEDWKNVYGGNPEHIEKLIEEYTVSNSDGNYGKYYYIGDIARLSGGHAENTSNDFSDVNPTRLRFLVTAWTDINSFTANGTSFNIGQEVKFSFDGWEYVYGKTGISYEINIKKDGKPYIEGKKGTATSTKGAKSTISTEQDPGHTGAFNVKDVIGFKATEKGTYEAELTVWDSVERYDTKKIAFTVTNPNEPSLVVLPPNQSVKVGETAQYQAIFKDGNGKETDVTTQATWSAEDTSIGLSVGQGKFTGTKKGNTKVKADYNNLTGEALLYVDQEVKEPEPPKEHNEPPTVEIVAPDEVEIGEKFCAKANATDSDGYIKFYDWNGYSGELDDDDDAWTSDSQCGLYYEDITEDNLWVQVTDDDGAGAEDTHEIKVIYPTPNAYFSVEGFPIENRAVWLKPSTPYKKNTKIVNAISIVKNIWTIEALDDNNQSSIVVIEDDLNNSKYDEVIEVLFRKAGEYKVTRYIENKAGLHDTSTKTVTITEDMLPTAQVETTDKVYLKENGKQTVTFYSKSYSLDDFIGTHIYEIAHDSDNDGSFEDEKYEVLKSNANEFEYEVSKIGKYSVRYTAIETFNEKTYESHVNLSDDLSKTHRKYAQTTTTFEVDNMAPVVSLSAMEQPEVEIVFNTGDVIENGIYTKGKLESNINSTLLPSLAAENINADIRIEEPKYYRDIDGGYYLFYLDSRDFRDKKTEKAVEPVFYHMSFDDGKLKRVNLPKEVYFGRTFNAAVTQIDYDNNLYYNVAPEKNNPELDDEDFWRYYHWFRSWTKDKSDGTWAQTNVEIYKYDVETDSNTIFADKNFIIDKITELASTNRDYVESINLRDIIVGGNENVYLEIDVRTGRSGKTSAYDEYYVYLLEFDKYGNYKRANHLPIGNDSDDGGNVTIITNNFIYFTEDRDNYEYIAIDDFFASEDSKNLVRDVPQNSRMYSTEKYDYFYGSDTIYGEPGLFRIRINQSTKTSDSSLLFKMDNSYNFVGLGRYYVYDYYFYNAARNGSLFAYLNLKEDDDDRKYFTSYRIFNDSNFALNNELQSIDMSNDLRTKIVPDTIFFKEDGTYGFVEKGRMNVVGTPLDEDEKDVYIFDEKTNSYLKSVTPQTTDIIDGICSWDDDDDECSWHETTFDGKKIVDRLIYTQYDGQSLPVRAYKKTLADTLRDTEWKSETSTKFYVTLSDQNIKGIPSETEEVASLLDQDDINYISIDTSSTKPLAQQIMDAIEQKSLQVTTTYTDSNVKTAMEKITNFIVGVVFPQKDSTADIHIGVDDSQYSLSAIQAAVSEILETSLGDAGFDYQISVSSLTSKNVNGTTVKKFNTNTDNDYYVLFKDSALTQTNLTHLVGDLLIQDAGFIGVGKTASKATFETVINKNMYRGTTFINPTGLNDVMQDISDYLIKSIRENLGMSVVYGVSEKESVLYETHYNDYENNPIFTEKFTVQHDPTVFENHNGKQSFDINVAPTSFKKVGLYQPTYQAMDNPLVNYDATKAKQFESYRKWSNVASNVKVYIHRMPVADFSFTLNLNNRVYTIRNTSYDLDKQSINIGLGDGIATQSWSWRLKGDYIWKDGLPSSPLNKAVYEIRNEVTDFQHQKNVMIKEIDARGKILPPVAEFTPVPQTIEEKESTKLVNASYEPTGQNLIAEWYYKKSSSNSYTKFATGAYTDGVGNTNWNPSLKLDKEGMYDVKLVVTDTDGMTDEAIQQVEVTKPKYFEIDDGTEGQAKGSVYWELKRFEPTKSPGIQIKVGVESSGKHFAIRNQKYTLEYDGVKIEKGEPITQNVLDANSLNGKKIKYSYSYEYTNFYELEGGQEVPYWEDGFVESFEITGELAVNHQVGDTLELSTLKDKLLSNGFIVGRSTDWTNNSNPVTQIFYEKIIPSQDYQGQYELETQSSVPIALPNIEYSLQLPSKAHEDTNYSPFIKGYSKGYFFPVELDESLQKQYENETDYDYDYAIPLQQAKVKESNLENGVRKYKFDYVTDLFFVAQNTGFVYEKDYTSVVLDENVPTFESLFNKATNEVSKSYKEVTGEEFSDKLMDVGLEKAQHYYIPVSLSSELKPNVKYTNSYVLETVGLSDINLTFDQYFTFKRYLIGTAQDEAKFVEQRDSKVLNVDYPHVTTLTAAQVDELSKLMRNRTSYRLFGFRYSDRLFSNKVDSILEE